MDNKFGPEVGLNDPAYIHPSALIYGKVTLDRGSSMWPYSVIRAEAFEVKIGEYTNIQDFVMIRIGDQQGTRIGSYCSVGHRCTVIGASIEANCLIGTGATIPEGCVVGEYSIVTPGTVLAEKTVIPPGSVVSGSPGKALIRRNNRALIRYCAEMYYHNACAYAEGNYRLPAQEDFAAYAQKEMERLEKEFAVIANS